MKKNYLALFAKSFNWAGFFLPRKIYNDCTSLYAFCRVLDDENEEIFEEEKGESETIAGFILEISGKFPKIGEKINFKNYTFTIEALNNKRIKQVKATRNA